MYDIIPGGGTPDDRPARPIRPKVGAKSQGRKVVYAGPRTVQLEWKLPSRLRKPIRHQLAEQRAQKRRRQAAAVSFARKPIHTQPLLVADQDSRVPGARVQKPRRFFNRGAEHHTGDVYKQGKPELHVAAPPYIGKVAGRYANTSTKAKTASTRRPNRAVRQQQAAEMTTQQPKRRQVRAVSTTFAERDVPMQWAAPPGKVTVTEADSDLFAPVQQPKSVMPGMTFSLWPGNWFGRKQKTAATSKKKRLIS